MGLASFNRMRRLQKVVEQKENKPIEEIPKVIADEAKVEAIKEEEIKKDVVVEKETAKRGSKRK